MTPDERESKLEELKLVADDYQYRDQLMVAEFALTMTAVGITGNILVRLEDVSLQILILLFVWVFLLIVSFHLYRINQYRISAGTRKAQLQKLFDMEVDHLGFLDKRLISTSVHKMMVWFSYSICGLVLLIANELAQQL